ADTLTEIDVFAVQEETVVPTADQFEHIASDEEARSRGPLHTRRPLVRFRITHHFVDPLRLREDPLYEQRLTEGGRQPWEASDRALGPDVAIEDAGSGDTDAPVSFKGFEQAVQGAAVQGRVGVEEQDEGCVPGLPAAVAAMREAEVVRECERLNWQIGDRGKTVVARGVVDDDDCDVVVPHEGLEGPPQMRTAVVRDDHDVHGPSG